MDGLAERQRQPRGRAFVGVRLEHLAHGNQLAIEIRDLDADRRLAGDAVDEHGLGLHREAQIVGEAGDLAVLDARVGLELVGRDHRSGMDLDDRSFDRELAALFFEKPRAVHEFALVDFAFRFRRVEQRQRRERIGALFPLGRCALGIGQWQGRRHRRWRPLDRRWWRRRA